MRLIDSDLKNFNDTLSKTINKNNEISKNINDFLNSKSKRIRPYIIFLFTRALNKEVTESIMHLAIGTELIHNATLIHDDIIDNARTRRGKDSLNIQLGNSLSVLAGDYLMGYALEELIKCNNNEIISFFAKSLIEMCNGEINQQNSLNRLPTLDEYIEKSKNKTAQLFIAALKSLCTIELKEHEKEIIEFALNFGIAFQLKDDLLNIYAADSSKPLLNDIQEGIYTLPVIILAKYKDIKNLKKDEIIYEITSNKHIKEESQKIIEKYTSKAIDSLSFIKDNQYKDKLTELTDKLNKA